MTNPGKAIKYWSVIRLMRAIALAIKTAVRGVFLWGTTSAEELINHPATKYDMERAKRILQNTEGRKEGECENCGGIGVKKTDSGRLIACPVCAGSREPEVRSKK